MTDLVRTVGVDPSSNWSVFLFCAIFTFAVVTILWVVGLLQGNHSMMDGWYGFAFAASALIAYVTVGAQSVTAALLLFMVMLHGGRLGFYLAARWRRYVPVHGGDPRYLEFVKDLSPGYWWKSFFKVMEPQAVVIVLIGCPAVFGILTGRAADGGIGVLTFAGLVLFTIGFYCETVADAQLRSFLALETRPRYLQTGVWKFTRHPNYFGNTLVWWAIWLVAVAGNPDCWWTVVGPVVNTIMLTSVLGSAFQDNYMGSRPEYQDLMVRTRRFLPIPCPKKRSPATRPGSPSNEPRLRRFDRQDRRTVAPLHDLLDLVLRDDYAVRKALYRIAAGGGGTGASSLTSRSRNPGLAVPFGRCRYGGSDIRPVIR